MKNSRGDTKKYDRPNDKSRLIESTLKQVYEALSERGYDPINQILGYILSEDPTYITSHKDARTIIRNVDRDDIIRALLIRYLNLPDTLNGKEISDDVRK